MNALRLRPIPTRGLDRTFALMDLLVAAAVIAILAAMLIVQDAEFFGGYKALVTPKHSLSYLPQPTLDALTACVKQGGALIVYASNEYTMKYVPPVPRWRQFDTRSCEHGIISIAPVDEPSMLGK
ncbi:MAG TPA: hypothetical protein P5137_11295 [Candidatus Brocadiia bacterium]|nr:hypothetical protein [Candidatus Brocadiia bacterium]